MCLARDRRPTDLQLNQLAAIGRSGSRAVATPAEDKLVPWADQITKAGGERLLQGRNDIPPLNMPWPVLRLREQRAVGDEIERSTLLRNHHAFFRKPTSRVRARVVP